MAITSQWTGPFRMFTSASLYAYCRIRQCACPRPRAAFKTSACHGPPRCLFCAPTHTCLARSDCHTSGGNLLKECLAAHPVDVLMWPRGIKTPQFSTYRKCFLTQPSGISPNNSDQLFEGPNMKSKAVCAVHPLLFPLFSQFRLKFNRT